tara:strand:- start:136 stop:801 length:666 start_codon:yes stop_codon:yes gene_type:complete
MKNIFSAKQEQITRSEDQELMGLYGKYVITDADRREVKLYRFSVLICGISFLFGLTQWIILGPNLVYLWLILMMIGLGSALKWIHIYIKLIQNSLQILWLIGCIGITTLMIKFGANEILSSLNNNRFLIIAVGPFFASLTGLGFKEFFCFRRPEAIGLTALLPITLLGYITNLISLNIVSILLLIASLMLMILSLRKFGIDPSLDIGDKSIFNYLKNQKDT